jgi:serine/threonine-protein kinase
VLFRSDLTPRNLFVCEDGEVKVLDFGIAKLHHAAAAATTAGNVAGTFEFLSPEQARADALDARSDLFQLAASLYYCLTGRSPHGSGGPLELLREAMRGAPPPLRALRPDLPAEVDAVVMKALASSPEARFSDALTMRDALLAVLRDAGPQPTLREVMTSALSGELPAQDARPAAPLDDPPPEDGPPTRPLEKRASPLANTEPSRPAPSRARPASPPTSRRRLLLALGGTALATAGALVGWQLPRAGAMVPRWQRRSFRRGTVHGAAFTPDGRGFVVSATWGEEPPDLWLSSPEIGRAHV